MLRRLASVALVVIATVQSPPLPSQSDWVLPKLASTYAGTAAGRITDAGGATLTVSKAMAAQSSNSATAAAPVGVVSARIAAESLRGWQVALRGELETRAAGGESLFIEVDKADGTLIIENSFNGLKDDSEWTPFTVSVPVPSTATSIAVGLILRGGGSVTARSVRMETEALRPDLPVAPNAQKELDAAIDIVKRNAWMLDNIDWTGIQPDLRLMSGGASTSSDVYQAIRFLLRSLNDHHSFLMLPEATTAFRTGGATNPPIEVKSLGDGIGYVNVPAFSGIEPTATRSFATKAHEQLSATAGQAECGWIVDLRGNGGGNVWPMLASLKPFLGDQPLGRSLTRRGLGPPSKAGALGVEPPASLRALEEAWVAVLTGPHTASSGEGVTISFKGRPHTRSFGQPTMGLSSGNGTFPLPDGAMIALTVGVDTDRTGKQYGEKVYPDEIIPAALPGPATANAPINPTPADATIDAAKAWLKKSCSLK